MVSFSMASHSPAGTMGEDPISTPKRMQLASSPVSILKKAPTAHMPSSALKRVAFAQAAHLPPMETTSPISSPNSVHTKHSNPLTPTCALKHRVDDIDLSFSPPSSVGSDDELSPSPRKRTRMEYELQQAMRALDYSADRPELPVEKSTTVVREEVRRAIQRHVSGTDSGAYDLIKEIFSMEPWNPREIYADYEVVPTPTTLKNYLFGLLSQVASLDRNCNGLVQAVLHSEWLGRDESYIKLFVRFIGNLAAAQSSHMGSVLKMLVRYLGALPQGTGKVAGYPVVSVLDMYTRVHRALHHVLQLIPSSSGALLPILSINFPFESDSAKANIAYTRNLLQVVTYAPELQADILALITEKIVKIDVQIQIDLDDVEDELGEEVLQDISPEATMLAEGSVDEDDDESVPGDEPQDPEEERIRMVRDNILKLDGMLDSLFEYYAASFTTGTLDDKQNALRLLISHFESIILPTYHSRHSQFLLFHFSQSSPVLIEDFAGACLQIIFNKSQPPILQQSAAAYLASFVARGAHVPSRIVRDVFELLSGYLRKLREEYEPGCVGPDPRRYGPFYSTSQALIYVFCFRWRDLTTASEKGYTPEQIDELEPEEIVFPPAVKQAFHQAIHSRLNPLKVCSPHIVTQFARTAQHLNFMYIFSILETNKRLRVSGHRNRGAQADSRYSEVEREIRAGDDLGFQLDAYFPFDPYSLPRSQRWVEGDYVHWRGLPGDHAGDSDSEAGEDAEDEMNEDTETADE